MAAITWRNVNSSVDAGAISNAYKAAGDSLNAGLGTLDKLLKQREAVDASNWENTKTNNSQAYRNDVDAMTSEQLAAAKQQLAEQRAGYGAQFNAELSGYADQRLDTLNTREDAARIRGDAALTRTQAPIIERFRQLGQEGNKEGQDAIRAANPGIAWASLMEEAKAVEARQRRDKLEAELAPDAREIALNQQKIAKDEQIATIQGQKETGMVDKVLSSLSTEFNTANNSRIAELKYVAMDLGFEDSIDPDTGLVDPTKLSNEQLAAYKAETDKRGLMTNGDSTSAFINKGRQALQAQGATANALKAYDDRAELLIRNKQLSATDAAALQKRLTYIDERRKKVETENPLYEVKGQSQAILARVFEKIPEMLSGDGSMTHNALKKKISTWATEGMEISGEKIRIPVRVLDLALSQGAVKGSVFSNNTDKNMEEFIKKYMSSKDYIEDKKEADHFMNGGDELEKVSIEQDALKKGGAITGNSHVANFNRVTAARKEEQDKLEAARVAAERKLAMQGMSHQQAAVQGVATFAGASPAAMLRNHLMNRLKTFY